MTEIVTREMDVNNDSTDDIDAGIDEIDSEDIKAVKINGTDYILKDDEIINPFFIGMNQTIVRNKELYSTYHRVLILCPKQSYNGDKLALKIYEQILDKKIFSELPTYFTLIAGPISLLKNDFHFNQAVKVNSSKLTAFNNEKILLNAEEIVIPLFDQKEGDVSKYISLYDCQYNLPQLLKSFDLNKYYLCNEYRTPIRKQLSHIIANLKETSFWENEYNCDINSTNMFMNRIFQYKEALGDKIKASVVAKTHLTQDDAIMKVIDKLAKPGPFIKSDYAHLIFQPKTYHDIHDSLKVSKHRTYYAPFDIDDGSLSITKDQTTKLFSSLSTEKEIYELSTAFLLAKDYWHMALNNTIVLDKLLPVIRKFAPIYRYVMSYTWLSAIIEESIFKKKITKKCRFVFPLEVASKLPFFPCCVEDIHLNPYMIAPIAKNVLDSGHNCLGLPMMDEEKDCGIATLPEFLYNFNVFTSGKFDKNILDGIDWKNFAVSGSTITACLQKNPPLINVISDQNMTKTDKLLSYFSHYYSKSDIDLMCKDKLIFDFMDRASDVIKVIKKNLLVLKPDISEQKIDNSIVVEPVKSLHVAVSGKYLEQNLDEIRATVMNNKFSVEDVINSLKPESKYFGALKNYFYIKYVNMKQTQNIKFRKQIMERQKDNDLVTYNSLYDDFFKISGIDDMNINIVDYEVDKDTFAESDSDICIYINDLLDDSHKVPKNKNFMIFKISENMRFKIKSEYLLHNIETFSIRGDDYFKAVATFHLPCVRAYYDGNDRTVYMLPSCISAFMTRINLEYKYFAGIRDPIEILNKYRMRGFGILLNPNEKQHLAFYNNSNSTPWKEIFAKNQIFGARLLTDELFKPGKYFNGFPDQTYKRIDKKYIVTIKDMKAQYNTLFGYDQEKTGIDLFKFKAFDDNGKVIPVKKGLIELAYSMLT